MSIRRLGVAVGVAVAIYLALLAMLLIALFLSGGGISCDTNCNGLEEFLADAAPWPMVGAISIALIGGVLGARRCR